MTTVADGCVPGGVYAALQEVHSGDWVNQNGNPKTPEALTTNRLDVAAGLTRTMPASSEYRKDK